MSSIFDNVRFLNESDNDINMNKWNAIPQVEVNGIKFGMRRSEIRNMFGNKFIKFKKSNLAKNTIDDFGICHIFYNEDDKCEAIEIFDGVEVFVNGKILFPSDIYSIKKIIGDLEENSGNYISKKFSIGIYAPTGTTESILFGKVGYYNDIIKINFIDRTFNLEVVYDLYNNETATQIQKNAYRYFIKNLNKISNIAKEKIESYCINGNIEFINIFDIVVPKTIYIKRSNTRTAALLCDYKYNLDDGIAIVFENEQFKEIGTSNIIL